MKPIDFVAKPHPANVKVSDIPERKELGAMLEKGEIDALISADNPKCILENSPKVGRLFPDYPAVEHEYFKRTKVFPIMHTAFIRKDLLAKNSGLVRTIYQTVLSYHLEQGITERLFTIEEIFSPELLTT